MTGVKTLARVAGGSMLAAMLFLGAAAPAQAAGMGGENNDPGPGSSDTSSGTGASSDSGDTATGYTPSCRYVSSPTYLGVSCASAKGGDKVSIKDLLGDDPVPDCWDEALTASELVAMGLENTPDPDGATWYWERCLKGIDPKTYEIAPGGIHFEVGLVSIKHGDPVKSLTANQQKLVKFEGVDRQIPSPVAGVSPSVYPRVGAYVSFFDGTPAEVNASAGDVLLRARIATRDGEPSLEVKPLGDADPTIVKCNGTGLKAGKSDTPASRPAPEACWYKYLHSSADQPDQKYPVLITAHWVAEFSTDGGSTWTYFNGFEKSQITTIPVTEIQSLVVR